MAKSIVWDKEECFFCGNIYTETHHIFGGTRNRSNSDADGLTVKLCRHHHKEAHKGLTVAETLHRYGQEAYEKTHTREEFMARYGKNYLD